MATSQYIDKQKLCFYFKKKLSPTPVNSQDCVAQRPAPDPLIRQINGETEAQKRKRAASLEAGAEEGLERSLPGPLCAEPWRASGLQWHGHVERALQAEGVA